MRTQIRTIALITATVAVLGALLVLFVRVRSEPEIAIDEDALDLARAQYERSRAGAAQSRDSFRAERGEAARAPRAAADQAPVEERRLRRSTSNVRPASDSPAAARAPRPPPAAPPGSTMVSQGEVRTAYDRGEFESALELAEKRLRDVPTDDYSKRVAVVAACAIGEEDVARKHYIEMVPRDQPVVAKRCSRYGVEL